MLTLTIKAGGADWFTSPLPSSVTDDDVVHLDC